MKSPFVRAFATAGAVAAAFAIGHSVQPATVAMAAQTDCIVHSAQTMPTDSTAMVRGLRVAV